MRASRQSRAKTRRTPPTPPIVPPVLPLIVFEESEGEHYLLTVNGNRAGSRWVHHSQLGYAITELGTQFGTAIRVEIHQRDGHIHVDLIPPAPKPDLRAETAQPQPAPPASGPVRPAPDLLEFGAVGFLAGEEVTLSLIVQETAADASGVARILIDRSIPPIPRGQIILRGTISGVTSIQPLN